MTSLVNDINLQSANFVSIPSGGSAPQEAARIAYNPMNQIAARPRSENFDKALQSAVHDPLFMLARQWQFGEYNFEDTGSAIFAKIAMDYTKLTRIKSQGENAGTVMAFNETIPLETAIERQPVQLSLQEKVRIGEEWLRMMINALSVHLTAAEEEVYKAYFLNNYSFSIPTIPTAPDDLYTASKLNHLYNAKEQAYIRLISGKKVDGQAIYDAITSPANLSPIDTFNNVATPSSLIINMAMGSAINSFKAWYESLYSIPDETNNCWKEKSLTYNAEMSMPHQTNSDNTVVKLKDYSSKDLDWYAFDEMPVGSSTNDLEDSGVSIPNLVNESEVTKSDLITVIPSQNGFPGMPASRWWEFEDGEVNFGLTNVGNTDLAKLILAEFALVYQDDWFVLPYEVETGSYATVQGILVKDVFGQQTLVKHAGESSSTSTWDEWNVNNLSKYDNLQGISPAGTSLFFPPTTINKQESEPLEEVLFFRDEVANIVWALEKKMLDFRGRGEDVNRAISELENFLINHNPDQPVDTNVTAELSYRLMTDVPMNWIPFIPVKDSSAGDNRSIRLQRASMPFMLPNYENVVVRPQTGFLRKGLSDTTDEIITSSDPNKKRLYIDEEIIPKAGIVLKKTNQRTRWMDGKTYLWRGTVKTVGRGQGLSNLQFDQILDTNKE